MTSASNLASTTRVGAAQLGRRLIANTTTNLAGQAIVIALAFTTTPYIVNTLGAAEYGLFVLLFAYVELFAVVDLGISVSLVRHLAELLPQNRQREINAYTGTAITLLFAEGSVVAIAVGSLAPWLAANAIDNNLYRTVVIGLWLASAAFLFRFIAQAFLSVSIAAQRLDLVNAVTVGSDLVRVIAVVVALAYSLRLEGVFIVIACVNLLSLGVSVALARRLVPEVSLRPTFSRLHCASILHFSKYVFIATLSSRTVHSLDKVIISQFVGPAGVGVYSIAQNLAQKLWLPVGSITSAVLPAASAVSDRARLGELYLRSSKMVVAITLFPAFALCLFRYEMLLYWLGPAFASAADATLGILSAACFLHALAHVPYVVAQAKGHPAITAAFAGVTAGLYLVLLVSLAQAFGIVGAAVSFLAVQTIVTPLFVYAVNRRLEISSTSLLRRAYLPAIAASVATVCFSLMTKPLVSSLFSLLLVLALDAVFHLMICTLVVLDRSERRAFWVYFRAPSDLQRSRVPRYSRP